MQLDAWLSQKRGRVAALAARLKVPASFISKMASGAKTVPLEHCPDIQDFTDGEVTCEELRPDKTEYFAKIRAQSAGAPLAPSVVQFVQAEGEGVAHAV